MFRSIAASAFTILFLALLCAADARAVAFRTFVRSDGNDASTASNCPRVSPCRTFAAAYSVVSAGGEVVALDSAGFGGLTITMPVTIMAVPGESAFISVAASTAGITVSAGATDDVILRNLVIGGTTSSAGVVRLGGNLIVENCSFTQLGSLGIQLSTPAFSTAVIRNSRFTGNSRGIHIYSGSVEVEDSDFRNNSVAIRAENQGPDQDATTGGTTPRTAVVRVSGGSFANNEIAFQMHNPGAAGTRPSGGCNAQNIFLRNNTNIVGNPTFLQVTGTADLNGACSVQIGGYSPQTQNFSSVANQ